MTSVPPNYPFPTLEQIKLKYKINTISISGDQGPGTVLWRADRAYPGSPVHCAWAMGRTEEAAVANLCRGLRIPCDL